MSRLQQVIDALEEERKDVEERLAWIKRQLDEFRRHSGTANGAPRRTRARSTTRRSTGTATRTRRASRGSRGPSAADLIVDFLNSHPNSTAGDVASALNLKRNSVSTRLTTLAREGRIVKSARGYSAK